MIRISIDVLRSNPIIRPRRDPRVGRATCVAFALGLLVPPTAVLADFPAFRAAMAVSGKATELASGTWLAGDKTASVSGAGVPKIEAYPLGSEKGIKVDGRLDDEVWSDTQSGNGFRIWDPDRGAPASENTLFRVAYDQDALYLGVACFERDAAKIRANLSRRDRLSDTDMVSVYLDPYHDRATGYAFQVNPLGVQMDAYLYNDGESDDGWDSVWQAETSRDPDGWYAELRIPFSSIRYRADAPEWGLQVRRRLQGRGESDAWVVWDRDTPGFVSRFGQLSGISGIPAPRQLEMLPYVVYRATDPAIQGPEKLDTFQNFGLDLKYGLTSDLTLNMTVQPDFGQIESDPAVLNLSPFETFFDEKRPFFLEGSRFFQHPDFNLFYSRRIGTGDENARIRTAGKLTGKTSSGVSMAALAAVTDVTVPGQNHNLFKGGDAEARYFVGRFGKEFNQGKQQFNVMQTAAIRPGSRARYGDRGSREAHTSGADFALLFRDRKYAVTGSAVGSVISPEAVSGAGQEPSSVYGTGGNLQLRRDGGFWRGNVYGHWESDKLDLNDLGFLSSADEMSAGGWAQRMLNPEKGKGLFNAGNINFNLNLSWLYAARTGRDLHSGNEIWHYSRGHTTFPNTNVNGWVQFKNFWEANAGLQGNLLGTQRYMTRDRVQLLDGRNVPIPGGGPLISEPATWGVWWGVGSDSRKSLTLSLNGSHYYDTARNASNEIDTGLSWNQSSAMTHHLNLTYHDNIDDTQHVGNFENPGAGIGGVSYVFGRIHQRTADVTLRTNLLFSRSKSLELYMQPYLTVGSYTTPRELGRPDTYYLIPYAADGFDVKNYDFRYASVNLNAVYRWEYRPGSTLFLVWTHSRSTYEDRFSSREPGQFRNNLDGETLFRNEPINVLMAKVTYWYPI